MKGCGGYRQDSICKRSSKDKKGRVLEGSGPNILLKRKKETIVWI